MNRQSCNKGDFSLIADDLNTAFMCLDNCLGNRQAETIVLTMITSGIIGTIEAFKQLLTLFLRDRCTIINDGQYGMILHFFKNNADLFPIVTM